MSLPLIEPGPPSARMGLTRGFDSNLNLLQPHRIESKLYPNFYITDVASSGSHTFFRGKKRPVSDIIEYNTLTGKERQDDFTSPSFADRESGHTEYDAKEYATEEMQMRTTSNERRKDNTVVAPTRIGIGSDGNSLIGVPNRKSSGNGFMNNFKKRLAER